MIFPLYTDRSPRRRPLVTEALIAANVTVYLAGSVGPQFGAAGLEHMASWGHFDPRDFKAWQLFTSLFLHDPSSIWHVAFNMLFLWAFGPAVEGRLKRIGFIGFYLLAGAVANIAHMMVSPSPVIGASGAVAGVTGLFLALFPRSKVFCFYIFTFSVIAVSSLWLIGLYFVIDVLRQTTAMFGGGVAGRLSNVAFMAHIAGYVYGFATGFTLLGLKVVPREESDVFFLFKQWRRRAEMRAVNRASAGGVWETRTADAGTRLSSRSAPVRELSADEVRIAELRSETHRLIGAHDLPGAAAKYRQLLQADAASSLNEQAQLEVANQLASEGDHPHAAMAYELLLQHFPRMPSANEVRLMLGMLYAREMKQPQRARELITAAKAALNDAAHVALADALLAELPA